MRQPYPTRIERRSPFTVLLKWHSQDAVKLGVGDADGHEVAGGIVSYGALQEFCSGASWTLLAGDVCLARAGSEEFRLRVVARRLSLTLQSSDVLAAVRHLSEGRPTDAGRLAGAF